MFSMALEGCEGRSLLPRRAKNWGLLFLNKRLSLWNNEVRINDFKI